MAGELDLASFARDPNEFERTLNDPFRELHRALEVRRITLRQPGFNLLGEDQSLLPRLLTCVRAFANLCVASLDGSFLGDESLVELVSELMLLPEFNGTKKTGAFSGALNSSGAASSSDSLKSVEVTDLSQLAEEATTKVTIDVSSNNLTPKFFSDLKKAVRLKADSRKLKFRPFGVKKLLATNNDLDESALAHIGSLCQGLQDLNLSRNPRFTGEKLVKSIKNGASTVEIYKPTASWLSNLATLSINRTGLTTSGIEALQEFVAARAREPTAPNLHIDLRNIPNPMETTWVEAFRKWSTNWKCSVRHDLLDKYGNDVQKHDELVIHFRFDGMQTPVKVEYPPCLETQATQSTAILARHLADRVTRLSLNALDHHDAKRRKLTLCEARFSEAFAQVFLNPRLQNRRFRVEFAHLMRINQFTKDRTVVDAMGTTLLGPVRHGWDVVLEVSLTDDP